MNLKPCKFTPKGSTQELSYDEFRAYLLDNYDRIVDSAAGPDGGETPPGPPSKLPNMPDIPEGERRVSARAKRIEDEQNKAIKDLLNDYIRSYESVSMEATKEAVQSYFNDLMGVVAREEMTIEEAHSLAYGFARKLLMEDAEATIMGDGKTPHHKGAFAIMLIQRLETDAIERSMDEEATKYEAALSSIGRGGGTYAAMMDAGNSLDPLANLFHEIAKAQEKELSKSVKSGRTKGQIVKEIQEEVEKANKEASEEAVETTTVDAAIDKATEEKAPSERKRKVGKKTELEKREKAAIERVKKAFASKSAPGPIMAATPQNVERVAALVELAKVEIEKGAYTLGEVVASVYKKVGQYVSKKGIREAIESEWENLVSLAEKQKREDLTELVKDALEGKSTDKIISALGKAIKIARPDFIKARMKGKKITEKQAIEEIVSNPEEAASILNQALQVLRNEVLDGKHLDLAGGVKPQALSQEQWDAARAKKVVGQFEQIVESITGVAEKKSQEIKESAEQKEAEKLRNAWVKAIEKRDKAREKASKKEVEKELERLAKKELEEAEREEKEAEKAYEKHRKKQIKQVIKDYYGNKNTAQSLQEYLAERFPEMSMQQINDLAKAVESQMERIKQGKEKAAITRLVNEITDGKADSNLLAVVARTLRNRGAMSQFGFANLLSQYLGYKGVSPQHIQQIQQMMQVAARMMPGAGKQAVVKAANNIAALYAQTGLSVLNDVMGEVIVRNILSAPRTALTGGLSVFQMSIPSLVKSTVIRPGKTLRGIRHAWRNAKEGRSTTRAALREIFMEHNVPVSRELPLTDTAFNRDRAWQRVRNMTISDIKKLWKTSPKKAISYAMAKSLIGISLQGKGVGIITNLINDMQTFLDYMNIVAFRDMYAHIEGERRLAAQGIFPKDPRFADMMADMLGVSPQKQAKIETQIQNEVQDMAANGIPVPKHYVQNRRRQLLNENTDLEILEKAQQQAVDAIGMDEPTSAAGSAVYYVLQQLALTNQRKANELGIVLFAYSRLMQPLTLFSRMALVLGEKAARYAPVIGPFIAMTPVRFTTKQGTAGKVGAPDILRDKQGNIVWTPVSDTREYAFRVAVSSALTAAIMLFLTNAYDEEELLDNDGNPVPDPENPGETLKRKRYKYAGWIDFYGSNRKIPSEQRGTEPTNSIRIRSGTNEDGTPRYSYWSFAWFPPQLYGSLKVLGEQRDAERFFDSGVALKENKGDLYKTLSQSENFDYSDIAVSAALNSFNFEFSNITRLIKNVSDGDINAMFNTLVVNPGKSQVSSKMAEGIEQEVYRLMDRHKIYVDSRANGNMAAHLMSGVWFTDPFIFDRKDFESTDPFGNPIDFPGFLNFVPSLFSKNVFYGMSEHENKHRDQYKVFYDKEGKYDPSILALPKRYLYGEYSAKPLAEGLPGVPTETKEARNLRRQISDEVNKRFGDKIDEVKGWITKEIEYEDRQVVIDYLRDVSIYEAIDKFVPDHNRPRPTLKETKSKKIQQILAVESIKDFNKAQDEKKKKQEAEK